MRLQLLPLVLACSAGAIGAQTVVRSTHGMTALPDRALGSGSGYVVELDASGVELVPVLGRGAPVTRRMQLERSSIRAGAASLGLAAPRLPRVEGDAAVYDLGGGVSERWTARPEGVELSYVFAERPDAEGDLTVTLRTTSNLPHVSGSAQAGWTFLDEDGNGIRVGAVTGIAADGARAAGWIDARPGELELGLPASFVRDAAYPLVLDPLFGGAFGVSPGPDSRNPVIANMDQHSQRLVVWEEPVSSTDTAILAQRVDYSGSPLGGLITLDGGEENANVSAGVLEQGFAPNDRFVVAWDVVASPGNRDVTGVRVDPFGNLVGFPGIAPSAAFDEHNPDVSSGFGTVGVGWVREGQGIRYRTVGSSSMGGTLLASSSANDHSPTVARHVDGLDMIFWVHDAPVGANKIQARVPSDPVGTVDVIATSSELDNPDATSHYPGDYVVAFEVGGAGNWDIWAQRVRYVPGEAPVPAQGEKVFASSSVDELRPAVASADREVVLAATRETGSTYEVVLRFLDAVSLVDIEPEETLKTELLTVPDVSGYPTTLPDDRDFMVVWTYKDPGGNGFIVGGHVAGDQTGDLFFLGGGCDGPGADPRVGAAVSSHPAFVSELHGAQSGAQAILAVGTVQIGVPWGAGTLHPLLASGFAVPLGTIDTTGYVGWETPLPPNLQGLAFYEQWAVFGPGANCALGPYDITDALEVIIWN